jgi:thiosulfate dehydrogenase [quinone] large subunit
MEVDKDMDRTTTFLMTRERTWTLTIFSVALFVLLSWVFGDGLFTPPLWNESDWISSPLVTYLLILAIVLAGWAQARGIPENGVALRLNNVPLTAGQVTDPAGWRLLMGNIFFALIWLPMRFFVGRDWISHGAAKVGDPDWMNGGEALRSFWAQAVVVPETGRPPIAYDWFRQFLQYMLDQGWYTWFSKLVVYGELLVGIALLVGAFVGLSAFLGTFMNFNYMLAGSASTNPVLFGLAVFLVLAWKVAGHWGLDRLLLPIFGARWARAEAQVEAIAERASQEPAGGLSGPLAGQGGT